MILRNRFRDFVPVVLLFVIVNALAIAMPTRLGDLNISQDLLLGGFLSMLLFVGILLLGLGYAWRKGVRTWK